MFDLTKDFHDLPSRAQMHELRSTRGMDVPPSPDLQPPWDIPETLVLTAAVSGRVSREGISGPEHSYPDGFEGLAQSTADVLEAGACGVHLDFGGLDKIENSGLTVPEMYDAVTAAIKATTNRDWIADCNVLRGENFYDNVYPLTSGIAEIVPMAPNFPVEWMESVAGVVSDSGARLLFSIHSAAEVDLADRYVYSRGLTTKPACWGVLIGYQYDDANDRLATFMPHPRAMLSELVQIVERIREIDPDGFIQVCAAGRAGHYLATAAILLGLHVRVGTEDTVWRFPHRNEVVTDSREMVERVRITAEALGRKLATPNEARGLLGLPAREFERAGH